MKKKVVLKGDVNELVAEKMYKEWKRHALDSMGIVLVKGEWKYNPELSSGVFFSFACEILLKYIVYLTQNEKVGGHILYDLYSQLSKKDQEFIIKRFKCHSVALSTLFAGLHNDHVSGRKTYPDQKISEWQSLLLHLALEEDNQALESNFKNRTDRDTGEKTHEVIDQIINNNNAFVDDRYLFQNDDLSKISNQPQLYCLMMSLEELLNKVKKGSSSL